MAEIEVPSVPVLTVSALARQHGLDLTRFAYLICGDRDRAEDLVQDALLAMHRRFGAELRADDPLAYARRAIVNANISWSRRSVRRELPTDDVPDRVTDFVAPEDDLWNLLQTLGKRPRAVIVMRYYLGYPDADIAEVLGCRRTTVRSIAARALAELRGRLNAHPEELS